MIEKVHGIVIDVRAHSDRHNIVTLYTRERGRVAFVSPLGKTRKGQARNARLSLLAVVEADVNFHEGKELQSLPAVTSPVVWRELYFNPVKSATVMFVAEFLNRLLRTAAPDRAMWDFIYLSLRTLDEMKSGIANFHIAFLTRLAEHAGISPHIATWRQGFWMDMRDGVFSAIRPNHPDYLRPAEAEYVKLLLRITYRNMHRYRLDSEARNHILNQILRYYAIHLPGVANLKSLDVLHEIFH